MKKETAYEFRRRLDSFHRPGLNKGTERRENELCFHDGAVISFAPGAANGIKMLAEDLADFFLVSMNVPIAVSAAGRGILNLRLDNALPAEVFQLKATPSGVEITAGSIASLWRGGVFLEDYLARRGGPFLPDDLQIERKQLITPRIVHSGWGIELFPDRQLAAIVHNGFDAIAVFCKGHNCTNIGALDFNDLIRRAADYGIKVYFYSYLPAYKHPDEPDAKEFFAGIYTKLFQDFPDAAGVMLVGESAEFPSHDPATTGKKYNLSFTDGIKDTRPSPGWWPCEDYPRWLTMVRDAVWAGKPDAEIFFNTYNWGWTDEKVRRKFLQRLPAGITVQVTYDIFSQRNLYGLKTPVMDYSIVAAEPGYYFSSECAAAGEYHIPLASTANTAGSTWDIGVIPYVPVPYRWITRFRRLDETRVKHGLSKFYDCHHYGWYPNVMTALGKKYFSSPQINLEQELADLAAEKAGAGKEGLLKAWKIWSDAFDYFPAANEDQYGPLRVGPSYPFIFQPNITRTMDAKEIKYPADPKAHFGGGIVFTLYQPYENVNQPPASFRYPLEIRALEDFIRFWQEGLREYAGVLAIADGNDLDYLRREENIGKFILNTAVTCLHIKQWWLLNRRLQLVTSVDEGNRILDELTGLLALEKSNVENTIPLVEVDSRLGWEPSMEYVGDRWHLEWKLRQLQMAAGEIETYRQILSLAVIGK